MSKFADPTRLPAGPNSAPSNPEARPAIQARFRTHPCGWFNWIFDKLPTLPPEEIREDLSGRLRLENRIFIARDSGRFEAIKLEEL